MDRRRLLRVLAVAGIGALAGCARSGPDAGAVRVGHRSRPAPSARAGRGPVAAPAEPYAAPGQDVHARHESAEAELDPAPEPEPEAPEPEVAAEPEPEPEVAPEPEPEPELVRVEVLCRDALGLAAAGAGGRAHTLDRLTVHHTAVALERNRDAPARLRGHQRYHQGQGWSDIAYHYAVDLAGNAYELRDVAVAGDTFTDYDPAGHFLVVCEGNYDQQQPTDAMLRGVAELLAWGSVRYGVPLDTVGGHRDYASTTCPGRHLQSRLGALRDEAARIAGVGVEAAKVCGPEGAQRVSSIESA